MVVLRFLGNFYFFAYVHFLHFLHLTYAIFIVGKIYKDNIFLKIDIM